MSELPPPFDLAERVSAAASARGIATAVIGAGALALHRFVRATQDVDLAICVDPDAIRACATPFDRGQQLEVLLAEATARWPGA